MIINQNTGKSKGLACSCFYCLNIIMFESIVDAFLKKFKKKHSKEKIDILAILGFGSSFNVGEIKPNSDLDLYIVIGNNGKKYRGVMFADGVEVDYFAYPLEQLEYDWKKVRSGENPRLTVAYILGDSRLIFDPYSKLKEIRREAKLFLKKDVSKKLTRPYLTISKYFIKDYLKDIEDNLRDGDVFSWQYNVSLLLNDLINIFCQFHGIPLVKAKYQGSEIAKKDKNFVRIYELIANSSSLKRRTEAIKKLASYCLKKIGDPLPNEWELVRSVDK